MAGDLEVVGAVRSKVQHGRVPYAEQAGGELPRAAAAQKGNGVTGFAVAADDT